MRVLIVKTSSMGDVIHTLPALTDAKAAYPDIVFDWVVEEAFAEVPSWHPAVDRVIPVAIRRWRKAPFKSLGSHEWKQFRVELARYHYDYVIDAQGLAKSAWITRLAKGPSYGYDRKSIREPIASAAYQYRVSVSRDLHAVERIRHLFAQVLAYPLPQQIGHYGLQASQFSPADDAQAPYLVCLHGTTRHNKHWPEVYWRRFLEMVGEQGLRVKLPWGNEAEKERAQRLAEGLESVTVLPSLNLKSLASVIAGAKGVVAVDTGLGHLTAALDIPCVSLYGSTSPGLIGAYGDNQVHLQAADFPCPDSEEEIDPALFAALTPPRVWQALQPLLPINKA
jgi:heptosyltransferase-1